MNVIDHASTHESRYEWVERNFCACKQTTIFFLSFFPLWSTTWKGHAQCKSLIWWSSRCAINDQIPFISISCWPCWLYLCPDEQGARRRHNRVKMILTKTKAKDQIVKPRGCGVGWTELCAVSRNDRVQRKLISTIGFTSLVNLWPWREWRPCWTTAEAKRRIKKRERKKMFVSFFCSFFSCPYFFMTDLETTLDPWWFHQADETIDISFRVPKGTKKSDVHVNSNNGIVSER